MARSNLVYPLILYAAVASNQNSELTVGLRWRSLAFVADATQASAFTSYYLDVVKEFPHVNAPFTQGLEISPDGRYLIETSGAYPPGTPSYVRTIDLGTGATIQKVEHIFGDTFLEGIVAIPNPHGHGHHWLISTYNSKLAHVLDNGLNKLGQQPYPWNGWGLARDTTSGDLFATNGTEFLMRLRPQARGTGLETVAVQPLACFGKTVAGVNELEMVNNFPGQSAPRLFGNIMATRIILIIDPETATCTGAFHLNGVSEALRSEEGGGFHVANGVAYSPSKGNFFVTGKNWEKMFEVRLKTKPDGSTPVRKMLEEFLKDAPDIAPGAVSFLSRSNRGSDMAKVKPNVSALQIPVTAHLRLH